MIFKMKKITLKLEGSIQELSSEELRQLRGTITSSGAFPLSAPCEIEIDCGNGEKYKCVTETPGETCGILLAGAAFHEEPIGIKCGNKIHQCNFGSGTK